MSGERVREIRERVAMATPGPWTGEDLHGEVGIRARGPVISGFVTEVRWRSWYRPEQQQEQQANAAFIAHAREDVPWLLARVEELEAILRDLVDPDPCHYDHHGYCQAHGWFEVDPACPHARARAAPSPDSEP